MDLTVLKKPKDSSKVGSSTSINFVFHELKDTYLNL